MAADHRRPARTLADVGVYLILAAEIFANALVQETGKQTGTALSRVIGRLYWDATAGRWQHAQT